MMLNETSCECGHSYAVGHPDDEAWHAVVHREYLVGPQVAGICQLPGIVKKQSLRLVRTDIVVDDEVIHEDVRRVVQVAQRCTGYPFGYYGPGTAGDHRMFILVGEKHAAAMVFIRYASRFWHLSWRPDGKIALSDPNPCGTRAPKIARIWVAAEHHRQGLAKWMIKEICLNMGVKVGGFGWELPLTLHGRALVKSLCPESFWGCGDIHAFSETIAFPAPNLNLSGPTQ